MRDSGIPEGNLTVSAFAYKLGLRLARVGFIRNAIDQRADLSEFKKPPTLRIFVGVSLICFSFLMAWPTIGAIGTAAIYFHYHHPIILAAIGTTLYITSHFVYLAGMTLSGEKYIRIIIKWLCRVSVEKMLASGKVVEKVDSTQI